jgi:DNA invertase Pin-like site-specific DNA recombinase
MRSTTNAAASRLAGALIGTVLLAILLAAPQASAAVSSESAATPSAVLGLGAGYHRPHGSDRVRAVQERLREAGDIPGPVDGRFGPLTEAAVRNLQAHKGLPVDGLVGPDTQAALTRPGTLVRFGMGFGDSSDRGRVRTLQRQLRLAGERPGPVDGRFGSLTERAVRHFQSRQGLAVDGIVGTATHSALARRVTSVSNSAAGTPAAEGGKSKRVASKPGGAPAAPTPSGQPKAIAARNPSSGSDGSGLKTVVAVIGLASALAVLSSIAVLRSRRRTRQEDVPVGDRAAAGAEPGAPGRPARHVAAPGRSTARPVPVLGYATIHVAAGARPNGGQLQEQAAMIATECDRRDLHLVELVREREAQNGGGLERPGLAYALQRIASGDAQGLVVAELPRLNRSLPQLGRILEWFSRSGARLVVAEHGIDTAQRDGLIMVRTLIQAAHLERERMVERTHKGMHAARSKGPPRVADNPDLKLRIGQMRAQGMTLRAIADRLNADGVPTVRGGAEWRPSSVQAAVGYKRPRPQVPLPTGGPVNGAVDGEGGI